MMNIRRIMYIGAILLAVGGVFGGVASSVYAEAGRTDSAPGLQNPLGSNTNITGILQKVINWLLGIAGLVAFLALIVGGIKMIGALGDEKKLASAKTIILWSIIGVIVILLSFAIINIIATEVFGSN